jgi:hypothetical protein
MPTERIELSSSDFQSATLPLSYVTKKNIIKTLYSRTVAKGVEPLSHCSTGRHFTIKLSNEANNNFRAEGFELSLMILKTIVLPLNYARCRFLPWVGFEPTINPSWVNCFTN